MLAIINNRQERPLDVNFCILFKGGIFEGGIYIFIIGGHIQS